VAVALNREALSIAPQVINVAAGIVEHASKVIPDTVGRDVLTILVVRKLPTCPVDFQCLACRVFAIDSPISLA
jgi:hypothetical protein